MANILVKSVVNQALSDLNSNVAEQDIYNPKYIEKKYRYSFSGKSKQDADLNDFTKKKTDSRLSYYKDFLTENDMDDESDLDESNENNYTIEFEDEPYEFVFLY